MSNSPDGITNLFEEKKKGLLYEETCMLFSLLNSPELVRRNEKSIDPSMFIEELHGNMFKAMLDAADKGAKSFKTRDLALRMKDFDQNINVDSTQSQIEFILSSENDPNFYKFASRVWEKWRRRECNRRLEAAIASPPDDDGGADKFDAIEAAMDLRKKTNPFQGNCKTAKETLSKTISLLESIWSGKMVFPKISSGYKEIDGIFDGGFDTGTFSVMGAATGHGKTAAAINMAGAMSKQGTPVVYISLEETYRDLTMRVITSQSSVPRKHLINKDLITDAEKRRAHKVMEDFSSNKESLLQLACGGKTGPEIIDLIRLHHERDGSQVFFVDYMQRIGMESDNRTAEIARFALALGEIARELELVIIGTSQLKREGRKEQSKRKPSTYDLSESSYLENEAAYIVTLFRQDLVPDVESADFYNEANEGTIEFICCKQRNGQQGSIWLNFDGPAVRMTSRAQVTDNSYQQQFYQPQVQQGGPNDGYQQH